MCLALANTGLANATTVPKFILNTYKEGLKGTVIEPDFLYIYEVAEINASSGYTTAAVMDGLFNQDNSGDGTADTTALEVNGVLRDIRQTPLAVNSAFADTTAAHAVFSTATPLHTYDNIQGNLALESVLSLSAMGLALDAHRRLIKQQLVCFSDAADADADAESAGLFPQAVQALAFKDVYDNAMATTGGNLNAGSKYTGMHKGPFTVNLTTALQQLETGAGIATGASCCNCGRIYGFDYLWHNGCCYYGDAGIISMTSFAKVV